MPILTRGGKGGLGGFLYGYTGTWFPWYAITCPGTHGLHLGSYHISRKKHLFCIKSCQSMRSMPILTQGGVGGWGVTYMDQRGLGSCGMRELVLVRMGCSTDHTISHV